MRWESRRAAISGQGYITDCEKDRPGVPQIAFKLPCWRFRENVNI